MISSFMEYSENININDMGRILEDFTHRALCNMKSCVKNNDALSANIYVFMPDGMIQNIPIFTNNLSKEEWMGVLQNLCWRSEALGAVLTVCEKTKDHQEMIVVSSFLPDGRGSLMFCFVQRDNVGEVISFSKTLRTDGILSGFIGLSLSPWAKLGQVAQQDKIILEMTCGNSSLNKIMH